jgi:hypothetical protein
MMDERLTSRPSEIRLSTRFFTAEIMRHADHTFVVAQLSPSLFLATSDYTNVCGVIQNGLRLSSRETIDARLRVFGPFNPPRKSYPPATETQVAKWDDLSKLFKGEP